jgi:hypothetical protein
VKEVNAETPMTGTTPENHPPESTRHPTNNNIGEDTRGRGATNRPAPEQSQSNKNDPPPTPTVSIPNGRHATKRKRRHNRGTDLITIYESEDEVKLEQGPVDIRTPHRHQADLGNFGFVPPARRRLMLEDETPPSGGTRKPSFQPSRMVVGQPQNEIGEAVYMDDRARPYYEYTESSISKSESSQYLDSDSTDDDGHGDCGLGGYKYCPDNPANCQTMRHQKDNPDPSDRGIT